MNDFGYLSENDVYLDCACQSLRPQPVIDALNHYYTTHNSCGERVKYPWGQQTDRLVEQTRTKLLKYLGLKSREYFVSFTLNTTYGINLLLSQLKPDGIRKVVTSDIEHNSPFLATMSFAKRLGVPREVVVRHPDGSVPLDATDWSGAVVVMNCASNIDGRRLENLKDLIKTVHRAGGLMIVDAAQAMAHAADLLQKTDADAICFSAHKMYAPSLGGIIAKRKLLERIDTSFVGGGMVDDVDLDSYQLSAGNPEHIYTAFEAGLQAWGEMIALGAAVDWLEARTKADHAALQRNVEDLHQILASHQRIHLASEAAGASLQPTNTVSFYVDGIDSHLLGAALADQGIMARTGYFCVHYYLDHVLHLPPLIRFSLGYHTRPSDIEKVAQALAKI